MNILMIGAGGIGGYYAAKLFEAGHSLVLTARGSHLRALQQNGLKLDYEGNVTECKLPAVDHESLVREYHPDDFDLIVIALKSTSTESLVQELGEWLKGGAAAVLSIQNGIDNERIIAKVVGEDRVIGGLAVRIGGHIIEPGCVYAEGVAQIIMGAWPVDTNATSDRQAFLKKLEAGFQSAGIPTTMTSDIRRELWRKLVINNGVNPLSALTGLDTRSLTRHPEFAKIVYGMMSETVAASRADGINLSREDLDEMFDLISNFNGIKTSMLVDKEKGRPMELDTIAGAVLKRCEQVGVAAPFTYTVCALLNYQ